MRPRELQTTHRIHVADARSMDPIANESVDLIVTSPPYPMIAMWDEIFASQHPLIGRALADEDGAAAFSLMHRQLDRVWSECWRVLKQGGWACINIGDATRTIGKEFRLFSNHARIIESMSRLSFATLPDILWRKPTNSPTKFLGSGMLPAGAYVTYEHEYILVFRKGTKRVFRTDEEKKTRRQSAFFWDERNHWFTDVWEGLKGERQGGVDKALRERSGAFPIELAYRLIAMHSVEGDVVLDPFLGTGSTTCAAMALGRSSEGVEIDEALASTVEARAQASLATGRERVKSRLKAQARFAVQREKEGRPLGHRNEGYGLSVMTAQEKDLVLWSPQELNCEAEGHLRLTSSVEDFDFSQAIDEERADS